jgi:hypothetical protein
MVKELAKKYVIYNGQLKSPKYMRRIELEKNVFGQNEDMVCCVCFKDNCDKTTCGHNICLKCRTRIVIQYEIQNKKRFVSPPCPVCRTKCVEFCINDIENSYNHFDDILRNMKCETDCRCEECARVIFASDEIYDKYKIKKPVRYGGLSRTTPRIPTPNLPITENDILEGVYYLFDRYENMSVSSTESSESIFTESSMDDVD